MLWSPYSPCSEGDARVKDGGPREHTVPPRGLRPGARHADSVAYLVAGRRRDQRHAYVPDQAERAPALHEGLRRRGVRRGHGAAAVGRHLPDRDRRQVRGVLLRRAVLRGLGAELGGLPRECGPLAARRHPEPARARRARQARRTERAGHGCVGDTHAPRRVPVRRAAPLDGHDGRRVRERARRLPPVPAAVGSRHGPARRRRAAGLRLHARRAVPDDAHGRDVASADRGRQGVLRGEAHHSRGPGAVSSRAW